MESPFEYNKYVSGAQFIGRSKEMAQLCNLIRERNNVLIYGPAKIGKKSLVYNSMELLRHDHKDITFCDINLFNIIPSAKILSFERFLYYNTLSGSCLPRNSKIF